MILVRELPKEKAPKASHYGKDRSSRGLHLETWTTFLGLSEKFDDEKVGFEFPEKTASAKESK